MSCSAACPEIPGYLCISESWTPEEGHWCLYQSVTDPNDWIDQYCGMAQP